MSKLTSNRPYLLRAYYEWLMDNYLTPHLVVDAYVKGTQVPQQYVKDGQIVLNIISTAVIDLQLGNETVEFSARFGGVPHDIVLPMASIIAIYARENGAGTVFDLEETSVENDDSEEVVLSSVEEHTHEEASSDDDHSDDKPPKKRGHLTVVK
ncbi:ClpXP protease specificity-enhancing factor [Parashewanella spongiae]|uniref:ClpXP protease specificity-enhancing factor n=1 Tax=Parashewanella spongiae TaxID=342950 RepID=A0A3A6UBK3_9GAMM|nr:ClpXP protease specificity-enhancing factor [Parashewanella spongiae]MCL1077407.1 ClpXP protease specificity-enhancing factor [Parashewanella spongiae]RJY18968.1 ClpXP protease specificity-enhancing factor [Parashewanella spongiae]